MALSSREVVLLSLLGIVGVGVGGFYFIKPSYDQFAAKWAQSEQLEQEMKLLQARETELKAQIDQLNSAKNPLEAENIQIKRYKENEREAALKEIINGLILIADTSGSQFIGISPIETTPLVISVDKPGGTGAAPAANATTTAGSSPATTPTPPPTTPTDGSQPTGNTEPEKISVTVDTFAYEFAIRGTYNNISTFISGLNKMNEIIEISNIKIENEAGRDRREKASANAVTLLNPLKPIRITASLKIFMLPKDLKISGI